MNMHIWIHYTNIYTYLPWFHPFNIFRRLCCGTENTEIRQHKQQDSHLNTIYIIHYTSTTLWPRNSSGFHFFAQVNQEYKKLKTFLFFSITFQSEELLLKHMILIRGVVIKTYDIIIPIPFQPDCVNLWYFKLGLISQNL